MSRWHAARGLSKLLGTGLEGRLELWEMITFRRLGGCVLASIQTEVYLPPSRQPAVFANRRPMLCRADETQRHK